MRIQIRRQRSWAGLGILLASLLLAATACESEQPSDTPATAAANSRTLTIATAATLQVLDPVVFEGDPSTSFGLTYMAPLTLYREIDDPALIPGAADLEPFVAESIERDSDGMYVVELRDAVSPYGNEITSEDVHWSFQRVIAVDGIGRFMMSTGGLDPEDPIEIIDEKTFKVRTTDPDNPLTLAALAWYSLSPLDSTEVKSHATEDDPWAEDWLTDNTAGFGPYTIDTFRPGEEMTFKANPNYWGEPPYFERIIYRAVADPNNRLQLINTGDADYVTHLLFEQLLSLRESEDVKLEPLTTNMDSLVLNNRRPPFDDERVRRALSIAINRDELVEGPYRGTARPLLYQIPSAFPQPPKPPPIEYDPEGARALLAEAGHPDGFSFTIAVNPVRPGPHAQDVAVLIASQLKEIGVDAQIQQIPSVADFQTAQDEGRLDAYMRSGRQNVVDVGFTLALWHTSSGISNDHRYASEEFDDLIAEANSTPLGPERDALLEEAHALIQEETPWIPLVETDNPQAFGSDIQGYRPIVNHIIYPWEWSREG